MMEENEIQDVPGLHDTSEDEEVKFDASQLREVKSNVATAHQTTPKVDPHTQLIETEAHGYVTLHGYKQFKAYVFLYYILCMLTIGIIELVFYWRPDWRVYFTCKKSCLRQATHLLMMSDEVDSSVCEVTQEPVSPDFPSQYRIDDDQSTGPDNDSDRCTLLSSGEYSSLSLTYRYFTFMLVKFVWCPAKQEFVQLSSLDGTVTLHDLLNKYQGYTPEQQEIGSQLYGPNKIIVEVKSYWTLLVNEVFNPFYVFQVAALVLWTLDEYYLYGGCILIISGVSIVMQLRETRQQNERLSNMVATNQDSTVEVLQRDDSSDNFTPVQKGISELVPGDVLVLPSLEFALPCDCVLIAGTAIVNESMLTGESVPVTKVALSSSDGDTDEVYFSEKHKRNTLFCGTQLLQTRYYGGAMVLAVVVRTGFSTAKGELVRSIMFPRPMLFKFYQDSMKFIGILFLIALIGMTYTIVVFISRKVEWYKIVIRSLDLVTIVVPPSLPAAMTVGTYYAQKRLTFQNIFCISPPRINVAGKIKLMCFDKTGTLTEDSLEVSGVVKCELSHGPVLSDRISQVSSLDFMSELMTALAVCHDLTYVQGSLVGDPMDIKMFESTKWVLEEPSPAYHSLMQTVLRPPVTTHTLLPAPTHSNNSSSSIEGLRDVALCLTSAVTDAVDATGPSTTLHEMVSEGQDYFTMVQAPVAGEDDSTTLVDEDTIIMETRFQVPHEVGVLRVFAFNSTVQRMSVVVRQLSLPHMEVYCKGAPEVVLRLCDAETVPDNVSAVLEGYTVMGYRVLALAYRTLPARVSWKTIQKTSREKLECELTFLGLLILHNPVKEASRPTIEELRAANIRTVMVTGDNVLTGISVARECCMVSRGESIAVLSVTPPTADTPAQLSASPIAVNQQAGSDCAVPITEDYHLAIDGRSWALLHKHFPQYVAPVCCKGVVFGRMSPDQKSELVKTLIDLDYVTGMCGDGANDCAALKEAHVGVSLSEAEASVAAPFTSSTPDVSCIPALIREGRAALTTNFCVFKFMAMYSIIQFTSVLILYTCYTNLSDPQFLYIDLGIITVIAVVMGFTHASNTLVKQRPLSSLMGGVTLLSLSVQVLLVVAVQLFAYFYLRIQPWFVPNFSSDSGGADEITWEGTVLFCVTSLQYLIVAVVYSPGYPFRKPLYSNRWLLCSLVILTSCSLLFLLYPGPWAAFMRLSNELDEQLPLRWRFRLSITLMCALHFALAITQEDWIKDSPFIKRSFQVLKRKKQPKNKYKKVLSAMKDDRHFPPLQTPIIDS